MTVTKCLLAVCAFFLPVFCFCQVQEFEVFGTLSGNVRGKIYMFFDGNYRQKDSISSEINDGKFYFKASAALPIQARLHLDQQSLIDDIYIDSKKVYVICTNKMGIEDKDTLNNLLTIDVKGSEAERLKADFEKWLTALKASGKPENEIRETYYSHLLDFVQTQPRNKVSAYLVGKASLLTLQQVQHLYSLLDTSIKNTFEAKEITKLLNAKEKEANLAAGQPFLNVILEDTLGRKVNTKDFRGKYVLIDFWASWCGPCRKANPDMKRLYDKLKGNDFEMLSVSFDHDMEKWKAAIVKDQLNWKQVIDKKEFKGALATHYAIGSIPTYVLLDKEGKIIDWNPSDEDIEAIVTKHPSSNPGSN